jgi:hypothetical protein
MDTGQAVVRMPVMTVDNEDRYAPACDSRLGKESLGPVSMVNRRLAFDRQPTLPRISTGLGGPIKPYSC